MEWKGQWNQNDNRFNMQKDNGNKMTMELEWQWNQDDSRVKTTIDDLCG